MQDIYNDTTKIINQLENEKLWKSYSYY
jgi:hypothetical protein